MARSHHVDRYCVSRSFRVQSKDLELRAILGFLCGLLHFDISVYITSLQLQDSKDWRRGRDSNPRYRC